MNINSNMHSQTGAWEQGQSPVDSVLKKADKKASYSRNFYLNFNQ